MARATPTIEKGTLIVQAGESLLEIPVGSTAWFEWLDRESSRLFAFHAPEGNYTARREGAGSGRGGWYWKAYRKHQGRLYRAYIGKTEDLTLERLQHIALTLSTRLAGEEKMLEEIPRGARADEDQGSSQPVVTPLLETRLRPPRPPAHLVERARLLELLDSGRQHRLTLLHAPAGAGKTTLVSCWLARRQAQAPLFAAWLSLEDGDNDPQRFWSVLIAACQLCDERIGRQALAQFSQGSRLSFTPAPLRTALTFLLNDLNHSVQEGVIILEDYHYIEHARIHETLTFFIEHLPASLHVIILTRSLPPLPLVRWRARGEVLELQTAHLRFSREESALFPRPFLPRTAIEMFLSTFSARLEGWAAGLRLLALSIQSEAGLTQIELLRLLILRARGKTFEARSALDALLVHLHAASHTRQLIPDVLLWQTRAQIHDNHLQAAEQTLDALTSLEEDCTPLQQQSIRLLAARLLLARGEAKAALSQLTQLLKCAQEDQHVLRALEIQLLMALAHAALKEEAESYQHLTHVLAQTQSEGLLRLFLDEGENMTVLLRELLPSLTEKSLRAYVQRILYACAHPFASSLNPPDALPEPLSVQEQRVLALLIAGRTNPEIAQELIISINTVKGHVKNLYRKLDVTNRVEASATARRLRLL